MAIIIIIPVSISGLDDIELVCFVALVVRFLAKRFLPQYEGGSDKSYNRAVEIENKLFNLTIIDKAGKVGSQTYVIITSLAIMQVHVYVAPVCALLIIAGCLQL